MLRRVLGRPFALTSRASPVSELSRRNPQYPFVEFKRHPLRGAAAELQQRRFLATESNKGIGASAAVCVTENSRNKVQTGCIVNKCRAFPSFWGEIPT